VPVKDTFVQYFINGTQIAYGNIYSFTNGRVGVGLYRNGESAGDKILIDYATLTTSAPSAAVTASSDQGGLYVNEATGEGIDSNAGTNPNMAPQP
jgi:hypothetical protein